MNSSSHVLIGKFLCEYVEKQFGIFLDTESFILGNVLPDYRLSFLLRPHFLKNNIFYIRKEVQKLLRMKRKSAFIDKHHSKHLGIICHYYADFFCFAHNKKFAGDVLRHLKYEKDLYKYFQEKLAIIHRTNFVMDKAAEIDVDIVYQKFEKLHSEYLYAKPSYDNDLIYSILACVEAITLITTSSVMELTEEIPDYYSSLLAIS